MVILGQKRLYSGKVVVFGQGGCFRGSWFYLSKSGCIPVNMVVFGQGGCIREKWLYLGKDVCISLKLVLFGQKWLYSGRSGCAREIGCIR